MYGMDKAVRFLLDHGANPNAVDREGRSPAHFAAHEGHARILDTLARDGADLSLHNLDSTSVLVESIHGGHLSITLDLLSQGYKLEETVRASSDVVRSISLNNFAEVTTFVMNVCEHLDARTYLLHFPPYWLRPVLKKLSPSQILHNICFARANDSSFDALTCIHEAAEEGDIDTAQLLVNAGALINLESGLLGTQLIYASKSGRMDIVKLFVRSGL